MRVWGPSPALRGHMSRCRHSTRLAAMGVSRIAAALLFVAGCGGAAASGAPAGSASAPSHLDQLERELATAEHELERDLSSSSSSVVGSSAQAGAAEAAAPPETATESAAEAPTIAGAPAQEPPADEEAQPKEDKAAALDSRAAHGDRCSTACKAYASMRRSAARICEIAGADDDRCVRARRRVDVARSQMEQSPCRCEVP